MDCSVDVKCLMDDVEDGLSMKLTDEKDCTDSIDCLPVCKNPNKLKNFNLITESKSCEQKTLNVRLKHLDQFLIADRKKNDVFKVVPANTCAVNKFVDVIRCPVCKTGKIQNDFTRCGILLAVIFFPLGLLLCILLTEKRCHKCGYNS